jgi:hypothetical protein
VQRAVHDGAVFGENLAPVSKKLGVVVLAKLVCLEPCLQVDMHTIRVLIRRPGRGSGLLGG